MRNDSKGRDIFYGIVAVATLIVAIIGATLAYFSMTASSNEGAVNATAAIVSVEYSDGQQVTAQADSLIPADFEVVQNVYEKRGIATADVLEDPSTGANMCIDKNDRQICSVYRFTIESEADDRDIIAFLNTEYNGFKDLYYAVYDVTAYDPAKPEAGWIELRNGEHNLALKGCSNENDDTEDDCFNNSGTNKKYNSIAINSMFGYEDDGEEQGQPLNKGKQTYDLVIFIRNANESQNYDQGQNYRGTIMVEILDGGVGGSGNIQGEKIE